MKKTIVFVSLISLFLFPNVFAENVNRAQRHRELCVAAESWEKFGEVLNGSVELAKPSIVHIESKMQRTLSPSRNANRAVRMEVEESASGIVAEFDGKRIIVTNRHVVDGIQLESVRIQTDDRRILTPKRILTNTDFDLAVIETEESMPEAALIGDSDKLTVGQFVLAFGSPFGLDRSVSLGIVSALGRRKIPDAAAQKPPIGFIQIDAAVNPGSSGGPILNLRGEVVGLVTAIATQGGGNEGVAFALPIKIVLHIAGQLAKDGIAVRPYLGVGFDPGFGVNERKMLGIDRMVGARINRVVADSPAEHAGLKSDDIVLKIDGEEMEDDLHVVDVVARSEVDKPLTFEILRDGRNTTITATPSAQISR